MCFFNTLAMGIYITKLWSNFIIIWIVAVKYNIMIFKLLKSYWYNNITRTKYEAINRMDKAARSIPSGTSIRIEIVLRWCFPGIVPKRRTPSFYWVHGSRSCPYWKIWQRTCTDLGIINMIFKEKNQFLTDIYQKVRSSGYLVRSFNFWKVNSLCSLWAHVYYWCNLVQ